MSEMLDMEMNLILRSSLRLRYIHTFNVHLKFVPHQLGF